ncbi:hypothetical protein [Williamwhitmania taraxaci]|nr:hypothetical protein [Williamwhitmania taraxaci]
MKMVIAATTLLTLASVYSDSDFIKEQKKYERVRVAYSQKGQLVKDNLKKAGIDEAKRQQDTVPIKNRAMRTIKR